MKKVVIICHGSIKLAPRVLKQVQALKNHYSLTLAMYHVDENDEFNIVRLSNYKRKPLNFHFAYPPLIRKIFSLFLRVFFANRVEPKDDLWTSKMAYHFQQLKDTNPDLIIAHHPEGLILGSELKRYKNVPLIFNAHEFYLKEFEDDVNWLRTTGEYYRLAFNRYKSYVDTVFSVADNISEEYKNIFNCRIVTIRNDKKYYDLKPSPVDSMHINIIHHGLALPSRRIEEMIEMMEYLDNRFHLYLMLNYRDEEYYQFLKSKESSRVSFMEPVDHDEIPNVINKMDIGLFILPPVNYNWENALPNKLFEFVQARLCIAVSPNPEMKRVVEEYGLGVVAKDYSPQSMANKISELSIEKIEEYKKQVDKNAKILSSEKTEMLIRNTVEELCAE